jgi:hypothetical protein
MSITDFCRPLSQRTQPPAGACTEATHAALKQDDVRWAEQPHVGTRRYEYADGDFEVLEHRNCTRCGSTLVRVIDQGGST